MGVVNNEREVCLWWKSNASSADGVDGGICASCGYISRCILALSQRLRDCVKLLPKLSSVNLWACLEPGSLGFYGLSSSFEHMRSIRSSKSVPELVEIVCLLASFHKKFVILVIGRGSVVLCGLWLEEKPISVIVTYNLVILQCMNSCRKIVAGHDWVVLRPVWVICKERVAYRYIKGQAQQKSVLVIGSIIILDEKGILCFWLVVTEGFISLFNERTLVVLVGRSELWSFLGVEDSVLLWMKPGFQRSSIRTYLHPTAINRARSLVPKSRNFLHCRFSWFKRLFRLSYLWKWPWWLVWSQKLVGHLPYPFYSLVSGRVSIFTLSFPGRNSTIFILSGHFHSVGRLHVSVNVQTLGVTALTASRPENLSGQHAQHHWSVKFSTYFLVILAI